MASGAGPELVHHTKLHKNTAVVAFFKIFFIVVSLIGRIKQLCKGCAQLAYTGKDTTF